MVTIWTCCLEAGTRPEMHGIGIELRRLPKDNQAPPEPTAASDHSIEYGVRLGLTQRQQGIDGDGEVLPLAAEGGSGGPQLEGPQGAAAARARDLAELYAAFLEEIGR